MTVLAKLCCITRRGIKSGVGIFTYVYKSGSGFAARGALYDGYFHRSVQKFVVINDWKVQLGGLTLQEVINMFLYGSMDTFPDKGSAEELLWTTGVEGLEEFGRTKNVLLAPTCSTLSCTRQHSSCSSWI